MAIKKNAMSTTIIAPLFLIMLPIMVYELFLTILSTLDVKLLIFYQGCLLHFWQKSTYFCRHLLILISINAQIV